ncbi:MAG: XTP/dITP diphosphatase [Roseburia sp.]|nr:XTP/dITP diphosphatase [Roseburia sp.]
MRKMIFATGNEGKVREVQAIMADMEVEVLSLKAAGISVEIEENGTSFEENALIKAKEIAKLTDFMVLADDSGLEIDYLNKEPGIYSARYLGEDTPYSEKNQMILERMENVEEAERTARFICAMAAVLEDGTVITTHGEMEGLIGYESKGENGFGYDPIFYLPEYGMTSAQISPEEKNRISHRGKALKKMKEELLKKWK